jgi:cytochrome c oxidase subunit 1
MDFSFSSFCRSLSSHFHFVLSLGAVIAIFSGIIFIGEKIVGSKILLPSSSSTLSLYHLVSTFIGILLTFSPMHLYPNAV